MQVLLLFLVLSVSAKLQVKEPKVPSYTYIHPENSSCPTVYTYEARKRFRANRDFVETITSDIVFETDQSIPNSLIFHLECTELEGRKVQEYLPSRAMFNKRGKLDRLQFVYNDTEGSRELKETIIGYMQLDWISVKNALKKAYTQSFESYFRLTQPECLSKVTVYRIVNSNIVLVNVDRNHSDCSDRFHIRFYFDFSRMTNFFKAEFRFTHVEAPSYDIWGNIMYRECEEGSGE